MVSNFRETDEQGNRNDLLKGIIRGTSSPLQPLPTHLQPVLSPIKGIKCVLFDIYGTLLVSGSGDIGVLQNRMQPVSITGTLRECGFRSDDPEITDKLVRESINETIKNHHEKAGQRGVSCPEVDIRRIWLTTLEKLGFRHDGILAPEHPDIQKTAVMFEILSNPVWPMPGFPGVFSGLKKKIHHLGIVSNAQFYTPLTIEALTGFSLEETGFNQELCALSYLIGYAKPSEEIFRPVLDTLNEKFHIKSSETLYIGNDMLNDIYTASCAGCRTVLFAGDRRSLRLRETDERTSDLRPDAVITSLDQLDSIIST